MQRKLERLKNKWFYLVLLLLLWSAFFPVLHTHGSYDPDALQILGTVDRIFTPQTYLKHLIELKNLDLQPLRDLNLAVDRWIGIHFHISTYALQNVFWWYLCLLLIEKIMREQFAEIQIKIRYLVLMFFAVHPIFAQVIPWGMARKHILSFFFILLATRQYLKYVERPQIQSGLSFNFAYLCAVLSQPISLLWPCWALLNARSWKKSFWLIPSFTILTVGAFANAYYYKHSTFYAFLYPSKTASAFDVSTKLIAIGHYAYQILFPFRLAFHYELELLYSIVGLIVFGAVSVILYLKTEQKKDLLSWTAFGLLPLSIMLTKAEFVMDVYLIQTTFAMFMIILLALRHAPGPRVRTQWLLGGLILLSTFFDLRRSAAWNSPLLLAKSDFENRASCISAFTLMNAHYALGERSNQEAKEFIENNECLGARQETPGNAILLLNFRTNVIYYEEDATLDERLMGLRTYSRFGLYPLFAYAALLIKSNRTDEAKVILKDELPRWKNAHPNQEASPFISTIVLPFCQQEGLAECEELAQRFKK